MDTTKLWELASETMYAFGPFYQEAMFAAIQETGAPNEWFPLSHARGADPNPLSLVRMTELNPYTAPGRHLTNLTVLADLDLLETVNGEAFRLTTKGRKAIEAVFQSAHEALKKPLPVSNEVLNQIADLLERIVKAAQEGTEVKSKWALAYSRWTDPGKAGTPAGRVDQYLTDLSRFRDDAHLAAWTPHMVSGPAWEALTFLWQEEINSPEAAAERLPFRGHEVTTYQQAFETLAAKGWIEAAAEGGTFQLTDLGREVRETAETETDRLFYAPWAALKAEEQALLEKLFKKTIQKLKASTYQSLWPLAGEASQAIYKWTRLAVEPIAEKHALHARGHLFTLIIAYAHHPAPVTAEGVGTRMPFSHPDTLEDVLAALAARDALTTEGDGRYNLTEKGLNILEELFEVFYNTLAESEVMEPANLADFEALLARLVKSSLEAKEPKDKAVLALSQSGHPKKEYGPFARIDQHLDDLNAFRDDAHLAAWMPYHLRPETCDAFTQIWAGEADNVTGLLERLQYRGYDAEAYSKALSNLVSRDWLEVRGDRYEITEAGQSVRDEVEDKTNQLFFAPWDTISSLELNILQRRLQQIIDLLKQPEPEAIA